MHDETEMLSMGGDDAEKNAAQNERDPEFEYDARGNIIIPDPVFEDEDEPDEDETDGEPEEGEDETEDEEAEDEEAEDEETEDEAEVEGEETETETETETGAETGTETGAETGTETETGAETGTGADEKKPTPTAVEDEEKSALRSEILALKKLAAQAAKALGGEAKDGDGVRALAEMVAEVEGKSADDILNAGKEQAQNELKAAAEAKAEYEKLFAADLAQLHATYPATRKWDDLRKMPKEVLQKFARFRDKGLSAKEAYAAADPDGIRAYSAEAEKKKVMHEGKEHLKSSVPKASRDDGISMTRREMAQWRELFPGKSEKELRALYKKTK